MKKRKRAATQILARGTLVLLAFFATIGWLAEKKEQVFPGSSYKETFILKISGKAQTLHRQYGVLPSISISQAILESDWGRSGLAKQNQNYYGIKGSNPQSETIFRTKEYVQESDEWIEINASFRKYDSWEESMEDHAKLLVNGTPWNPQLYRKVIEASEYKEAAYALHEAGYATDPTYPEKLIRLIEQHRLYEYDQ